jgi:hypothetical protein
MIFSTDSAFRLDPSFLKIAKFQFFRLFRRIRQADSHDGHRAAAPGGETRGDWRRQGPRLKSVTMMTSWGHPLVSTPPESGVRQGLEADFCNLEPG